MECTVSVMGPNGLIGWFGYDSELITQSDGNPFAFCVSVCSLQLAATRSLPRFRTPR